MSIGGYLKDMYKNPERYNKLWISLLTAALTLVANTFPDNQVLASIIPFAGAFGVFITPNKRINL